MISEWERLAVTINWKWLNQIVYEQCCSDGQNKGGGNQTALANKRQD